MAFSATGTLAFVPGPTVLDGSNGTDLALFDGRGGLAPLKLPPAPYTSPRVSPDGKFVAFDTDDVKESNVWVHRLAGGSSPPRLTFGGRNRFPTWSNDGQWVLFQSDRDGDVAIFRQRADGSGTAERVTRPQQGESHVPQTYARDGRHLIVTIQSAQTSRLAVLSFTDRKLSDLAGTESADRYTEGALSPDGRWLAFQTRPTNDAVRQVFLQPFPATGARYLVRNGVGGHPYWMPDGKSLLLNVAPNITEQIPVTLTPAVQFGDARPFSRSGRTEQNPSLSRRGADPLPDGRQVIGVVSPNALAAESSRIVVVLNWFDELRRLVPAP